MTRLNIEEVANKAAKYIGSLPMDKVFGKIMISIEDSHVTVLKSEKVHAKKDYRSSSK